MELKDISELTVKMYGEHRQNRAKIKFIEYVKFDRNPQTHKIELF